LRSREYDSKKKGTKVRVWEVRVDSILKLDRAEKVAQEEREEDEFNVSFRQGCVACLCRREAAARNS